MKVLEVFGEPVSHGGQESFVFNVLQHMDLEDLQIDVLTPYYCDNEHYRGIIENRGGKLVELGLPFEPGKSRSNIYKPIKSYLIQASYDAVHIHSGSISVLALASLAAKRSKVKRIIVHSHCAGDKKNMKYQLTKTVMTPVLDFCPTDYCACSLAAGEWKFSPKAVKKMRVLKNGVDLDKFRYSEETRIKMRKHLGLKENDFVIGHVGRFSYQKNQEYIIEMLKNIKPVIPNCKSLLIGTGETMDQIRSMVRENGLSEDVLFIGNVNNVQDYLQVMDVFVLPSRFEGLPIVGVEAQAAGLRVISSTNVSDEMGLTALVQFVSLDNIDLWIDAIKEAIGQKHIDAGEELRQAGYDINTTAAVMKNLYLV